MFKVQLEDRFVAPKEAPPPRLPIPMPETLADAKRELADCEARQDWSRSAALKYAAIPYLERHGPRACDDWEDVPEVKTAQRPKPQAPFQPPSFDELRELPPWALAAIAVLLWTALAVPLIDVALVSLFSSFWGPIVTVRRGPADHTGCLELYLSIAIWFFGLIPAWGGGYGIGEALGKK
jgi:hypothetical protein